MENPPNDISIWIEEQEGMVIHQVESLCRRNTKAVKQHQKMYKGFATKKRYITGNTDQRINANSKAQIFLDAVAMQVSFYLLINFAK